MVRSREFLYICIALAVSGIVLFVYAQGYSHSVTVYNPKADTVTLAPKEITSAPPAVSQPVAPKKPEKPAPVPAVNDALTNAILRTLEKESLPDLSNLEVVRLDVPLFKQQYIRSCEEASLRMVLAFYGIQTTDMDIVQKVGYDPKNFDAEENVWDDPNRMFVGYIDDSAKSGYGVFAPPIAKAAIAFGRDAEPYTSVSPELIAEEIYQKHPVIVWGLYSIAGPYYTYHWKTEEGKLVTAYRGEHARVVVGVVGSAENPVGFFVNDPITGEKDAYWSAERLMKNMNTFGSLSNQAVVVR